MRAKKPSLFPARVFSASDGIRRAFGDGVGEVATAKLFWRRAPSRAVAETINILRAKLASLV
jgi:hypothetical protein